MRARVVAGLLLGAVWTGPAAAKVFLTVDEALRLAFPDAVVDRRTVYLTEEQQTRAKELAGVAIPRAIVHPYVARKDGVPVGTAYFDAHRVRTLPETLMIVVDPDGRVARLEVLSFDEPPDYLPREAWYAQFRGKPLDEALALKRDIRGITGATLTARATTDAVRRVLALHRVLQEAGEVASKGDGASSGSDDAEGGGEGRTDSEEDAGEGTDEEDASGRGGEGHAPGLAPTNAGGVAP